MSVLLFAYTFLDYLVRHECSVGIGSLVLFVVVHANLLDPLIQVSQNLVMGLLVFLCHRSSQQKEKQVNVCSRIYLQGANATGNDEVRGRDLQ